MTQEIPTEHPHIVRLPGTLGGTPVVRGTSMPVRLIAVLWKAGESVDDIVQTYPHLRPSWVHDAISYYLDHQPEVEAELRDNPIENVISRRGGQRDERGDVRFPPG